MLRRAVTLALAVAAASVPGACDSSDAQYCRAHSECAVGLTCVQGLCQQAALDSSVTWQDGGALPDAAGHGDGGPAGDSNVVPLDGGGGADGQGGTCSPNNDGVIERAELPIVVGAKLRYTLGSGITVNLAGSVVGGKTVWTLKGVAGDDKVVSADLQPLFGWAKPSFPQASYASLLDATLATYGVFAASSSALSLVGVVSESANRTKLSYAKPLDMLRFPLKKGDAFATTTTASGTLNFVPLLLTETYAVSVIGQGRLELPKISFDDALLVHVKASQNPTINPLLVTRRSIFLFIASCRGIVARVVADGHPSALGAVRATQRWRISF